MFALVDVPNAVVVPQKGQTGLIFHDLSRVNLPNGAVVFNPPVGYENPPQYGEAGESPVEFRLYSVSVVEVGSGPSVASISDPVFDVGRNVVTATKTLRAAPVGPTPADQAETAMTDRPFERAWVRRQAQLEGKTTRQIMDEIRDDV